MFLYLVIFPNQGKKVTAWGRTHYHNEKAHDCFILVINEKYLSAIN